MAQVQPEEAKGAAQNTATSDHRPKTRAAKHLTFFQKRSSRVDSTLSSSSNETLPKDPNSNKKSFFGILEDKETDEVPGTVILLSNSARNVPLGEEKTEHHKDDAASIVSAASHGPDHGDAKRTSDGNIILNPQPEDTPNDPLNWPAWRRDIALLCLGFYCMLGGGMTPVLAAGFNQVAATYQVTYSKVALTTGLYMMGLGVGSVIFSPTAFLYGKRTVYLVSAILFVLASVWCALAPNYANLVVARVFQGIAVSPVECLPSATIAEIFFLHERAFRVGIYTLLLLGGKNLIPLVSAAIIQAKGWRWVFWIVAIIVGFSGILLFFFVPETFWDRTPRPRRLSRSSSSHLNLASRLSMSLRRGHSQASLSQQRSPSTSRRLPAGNECEALTVNTANSTPDNEQLSPGTHATKSRTPRSAATVHFAQEDSDNHGLNPITNTLDERALSDAMAGNVQANHGIQKVDPNIPHSGQETSTPGPLSPRSPLHLTASTAPTEADEHNLVVSPKGTAPGQKQKDPRLMRYTTFRRQAPPVSYLHTLQPWNGRMSDASWVKVCIRPFILYAYPSVLWSAMVYSLSVGWLIVLSEAVAHIYETRDSYNFSSIQVGLVYLSPFVGGVLGTAVAGRVSDVIVRWMARRNNGIYEPEYRLVMAIPIALCTAIGLMGFGWSAQERDNFMVPTIFFGIISFGCCIGSTTAITFCVDSYRQFAAEALVTLNFSKNIFHGLVWSLFFPNWLQSSGSKTVFLAIGGIQIACMLFTIPMYIYGKRARMWTVRKKMMERF